MKGLKKLLPIGLVVVLLLMVMPMTALAAQTVTGSTVEAYTISTTVDFGAMPVSGEKTMADVVTASYASTVTVDVDASTSSYAVDVLTKLEYLSGGPVLEATINTPSTPGVQTYPATAYASGNEITMADTDKLALKAYTGTVAGTWDPVVITLTVAAP